MTDNRHTPVAGLAGNQEKSGLEGLAVKYPGNAGLEKEPDVQRPSIMFPS